MSGPGVIALGAAQFIPGVDVIVDAALVVGVVGLGGYAIIKAYQNSQTQLKDAPQAQACADCGDGPDCFEPPDRSDPKKLAEFRRQLRGQESGINDMSPQELMDNINKYNNEGGRDAYPGEAAGRRQFRQQQWNKTYDKALDRYGANPNAEQLAEGDANAALKGQSALHNPDMKAGGRPQATDLGGSSENSSLGSQWTKVKKGSKLSRADQLKKAAEKAKADGKSKMDVKLDEC